MGKMKIVMGFLSMALMVTWLIGTTSDASSATPGTVSDPIVTKSYVDQKDGEVKAELTELIEALGGTTGEVSVTTAAGAVDMDALYAYIDEKIAAGGMTASAGTGLFTVIKAENGQKIICGASGEIILRSGSATVIAGINGDGLADLTEGNDLSGGEAVPKQHHLLVSRDDGRGIQITSENLSYILVKGAYTVE